MKHITIIILLLLSLTATAQQRIHAFVSSGLTVNQIEGDEIKGFKHFGYTGGVGALVSLSSNNRWGMSIEALFSQHGSHSTGDTRYYLYKMDLTANYIEIPLLLHFQDPHGGMLFGAGVSYGRLVRQPHGEIGYQPQFFIPDTSDMTFLPNDLMVVADARFTVWRGLQIDLRWQYSLMPIKRDWNFYSYAGYTYDENGNQMERWVTRTNNCYNNSIVVRLIWQF